MPPGEKLTLQCNATSRGSPRGRVYWEGPRKLRIGIGIGKSKMKPSKITFGEDFSLSIPIVSRRDRGFYRYSNTRIDLINFFTVSFNHLSEMLSVGIEGQLKLALFQINPMASLNFIVIIYIFDLNKPLKDCTVYFLLCCFKMYCS